MKTIKLLALLFGLAFWDTALAQTGMVPNGGIGAAVKPASTAPVAADPSLVVSISPNSIADGTLATGTCSSACNGTTLLSFDTAGSAYTAITSQTTTAGSGTLTWQSSDDGVTYSTTTCYGDQVFPPSLIATNSSFTGVQICPVINRYMRLQFTGYSSGTFTVTAYGRTIPTASLQRVVGQISVAPYPANSNAVSGVAGAVPITASSGNVAAATATATLAAAASKTTYISGFEFTSSGATGAAVVTCTLTGTITGTMSYTVTVVAGATLGNVPLVVNFNPAVPSSTTNTAIVASCPSLGTGNTNATMTAHGYQL